jgi:hypothetical protein
VRTKGLLVALVAIMVVYGIVEYQRAKKELQNELERSEQMFEFAEKIMALRGEKDGVDVFLKKLAAIAPPKSNKEGESTKITLQNLTRPRLKKVLTLSFGSALPLRLVEIKKGSKGCDVTMEIAQ